MIEVAVVIVAAVLSLAPDRVPAFATRPDVATGPDVVAPATFLADSAEVSSWRPETRRNLEPAPLAIAAAWLGSGRPVVSRCVKLNNPWCIKSARWPGEIGRDQEGHTAFGSTAVAADAAVTLLRTYYVSYGLHASLDIVRRWAPDSCPGQGLTAVLAVRGLANTLRARFLAGRFPGGRSRTGTAQPRRAEAASAGRRAAASRVPLARLPAYRVPDLAPGLGEHGGSTWSRPTRVVARTVSRAARAPVALGCGSQEGRILAYASAIGRALGVDPGQDLKLFDEAGAPTPNLLPVLVAMSAIELGHLHAGPELVEAAVGRLRDRLTVAAGPAPGRASAPE